MDQRIEPEVNRCPTPECNQIRVRVGEDISEAHTAISRFVDHIPYYRQEQINARSGVRTPRSTLAAWGGQTGAQLRPLYEAHWVFVRGSHQS